MVFRGLHHLAYALRAADVARIDAQAGGTRLRCFNRPFVVKMDVGHDRHGGSLHDVL